MIYYFDLKSCCQCFLNDFITLLKRKGYNFCPQNQIYYEINTEAKTLIGVGVIPTDIIPLNEKTSYKQLLNIF